MSQGRKPSTARTAKVLLTERALADIAAIRDYSVAEWGAKAANRYLDSVTDALDRIAHNPNHLRHEPGLSEAVSLVRIRKHFLICDRRDSNIVILTVIHTSMDLPIRLAELLPTLAAEVEFLHNKLRTMD